MKHSERCSPGLLDCVVALGLLVATVSLLAGNRDPRALEGPIREAPPIEELREVRMVAPASRKALVFSGITDTLDVGGIIPAQSIVVLQYGDTFFFHVPAMRVQ